MGRHSLKPVRYSSISDKSEDDDEPIYSRPTSYTPAFRWKLLAIVAIAINIILLLALVLSLAGHFQLILRFAGVDDKCHLASETLWGRHVPWKKTVINNQQEFIDSDPWESKFGQTELGEDVIATAGKESNPWDKMWFPTWMALENDPAAQGYGFGTPLTGPGSEGNENDPIPWKEGSQAFGIGVMHQMHCVVSIKMALNDHRYFGGRRFNSTMAAGHIDHCVEVLRQATICHGDLALLRPDVPGMGEYTAYDGWGNEHICRDWDAIQEILKEHGIYYAISEEMKGWTHWRYSAD